MNYTRHEKECAGIVDQLAPLIIAAGLYVTPALFDNLVARLADLTSGGIPADGVDPAAVFGAAQSICRECEEAADTGPYNLSDAYSGGDEFMRQCMRVGQLFEVWSCDHVDFDALNDVWPYMLEDKFGKSVLVFLTPEELEKFDEKTCESVAHNLGLALKSE